MLRNLKPTYPKPPGLRPTPPPRALVIEKPPGPPPIAHASPAVLAWPFPPLCALVLLIVCALLFLLIRYPAEATHALYLLGLRADSPSRGALGAPETLSAALYLAPAASPTATAAGSGTPAATPSPAVRSFPLPANVHVPSAYRCTPGERAAQVAQLRPEHSNCPSAHYWPAVFSAALACRDLVVVDVGANKGYLLAHWADLFRPALGVTPALLHTFFIVPPLAGIIDPAVACGACNDCFVGHLRTRSHNTTCAPPPARPHSLHMWALEPVPGNVALLEGGVVRAVAEGAAAAGDAHVAVHVEQVAMVGDPAMRTVAVGVCPPGREVCGVKGSDGVAGGPGAYNVESVNVSASTLDAWVEARGLAGQPIDVLAIDTEGFDAPVIAGGAALFSRGGVRLLLFEYHNFRAWSKVELRVVVEALDGHGYDCFLLQKKLVLRLTGCWEPAFEFKQWSNVMCAYRAEEALLTALSAFTSMDATPGRRR